MMSRRNGTGMKFLLTVVIGGVFIFGLYTYHDQQTKLRRADENADKMQQQHDSLAAQLQVLFEHKSRLEKSLKTEESAHKKTRDDLTAEMSESEIRHANEKQDILNRINSINKDYKMLQSQHEDLQADLTRSQSEINKVKDDHQQQLEQHNAEYMQLRQEHQNSEAVMQNEVADLKQRNNNLLVQLDRALQNRDNNQHQLEVAEQEMIRMRRQLDRSQQQNQLAQQQQALQQQQDIQQQQQLLQQQQQPQELQMRENLMGQGHGLDQGHYRQDPGQANLNQQFWRQQQQQQQQQQPQQKQDTHNVLGHVDDHIQKDNQPLLDNNVNLQQLPPQQQQQQQQAPLNERVDRDLGEGQAQAYQQRQMEQHEGQEGQQMVIAMPVDQQPGYHKVNDPAPDLPVNADQMQPQQPAAMDQVGPPRMDNDVPADDQPLQAQQEAPAGQLEPAGGHHEGDDNHDDKGADGPEDAANHKADGGKVDSESNNLQVPNAIVEAAGVAQPPPGGDAGQGGQGQVEPAVAGDNGVLLPPDKEDTNRD